MRALSFCGLAVLLAACGKSSGAMDAGRQVDTSCGLDCEAQQRFGLVVGRCVQYSDTKTATPAGMPPAMATVVQPVFTLEDNVKVLPVEYRQGGQIRMTDSFTFTPAGDLKLVRREFAGNGSVSFQNDQGVLTGVTWLTGTTAAGDTATSSVQADVIGRPGGRVKEATTYKASALSPTADELVTPEKSYDGGLTLLFSETPEHAADSRRTYVAGEGFVIIATPLGYGNAAIPYRQQKRLDGDGGFFDCSVQ
ncbi:MAG: hypothetical protein K1X89_23430 [Myxococcaceae bacterium]|nr:hypothetical protein [Myxococcaceae bacterium]